MVNDSNGDSRGVPLIQKSLNEAVETGIEGSVVGLAFAKHDLAALGDASQGGKTDDDSKDQGHGSTGINKHNVMGYFTVRVDRWFGLFSQNIAASYRWRFMADLGRIRSKVRSGRWIDGPSQQTRHLCMQVA